MSRGPSQQRRDIRPVVYAVFDFLMVVVYVGLLVGVLPAGHRGQSLLLWAVVGCVAVAGGAMFVPNRWGWRIAAGACALLLLLEFVLLVVLVWSASFLAGVYGGFGRGAALITVLGGFVTIQLVALLPALQLKFLMTRAGRRCFGVVAAGASKPAADASREAPEAEAVASDDSEDDSKAKPKSGKKSKTKSSASKKSKPKQETA